MQTNQNQTWTKKNIPLLAFGIDKGMPEIQGKFLKRRDAGEITDKETGEIKHRTTLIFEKLDTKEKFQIWENGGLKAALSMNDVEEGAVLKIVHLGKTPRGAGKPGEVNQYDIFTLN